jgi:hypothetical protein
LSACAGPGLDYFNQGRSVIAFLIDVVKSLQGLYDYFRKIFGRSCQNDEMAGWIDVGSGTYGM